MFHQPTVRFWAVLALSLLAACGGDVRPATQAPSRAPAATAPQQGQATVAASPEARPAATAAAAQPASAPSAAQSATAPAEGAAIPESLTPEGYHVLGRADAPVTLTMYSDFL